MDRSLDSPHRVINPDSLPKPSGYSHVVVAQSGRIVFLAGQVGQSPDGSLVPGAIAEQFDAAAANVVKALDAAGAHPQDLVSMQIFVTDIEAYQRSRAQIRESYQRHFGKHYPAMALLEVTRLYDPAAVVELMCVAVTA
jgi:enamine deaminase RidA (YjgF/YER057c/UK114 family)